MSLRHGVREGSEVELTVCGRKSPLLRASLQNVKEVKLKFRVSDSQKNRHKAILAFVNEDQNVIAVILAAIDLESTIRRVIDGML